MIDDDELRDGEIPDEDEVSAFTEQWAKLWARAADVLKSVGWENDKHGTFYGQLWDAPEGWTRTAWAAGLATMEAQEAKAFADSNANVFVRDAAATLVSLAAVLDAVAKSRTDRPSVRSAALWSMNAATYMLRRHAALPAIQEAVAAQRSASDAAAQMKEAQERYAQRLPGIAAKSANAYDTAEKRRLKWWPRGQDIARSLLADDPRTTNDTIATEIVEAGRRAGAGFNPPGHRTVSETVGRWRGVVDGIAYAS